MTTSARSAFAESITAAISAAMPAHGAAPVDASPIELTELRPLTGGASLETWRAQLRTGQGSAPIIIRRDRPGVPTSSRRDEAELLRVVHRAGVPVPRVLAESVDGDSPAFFVMEFLEGETIPRKLLRDERFAAARPKLGAQVGEALARIHTVSVDQIGFLGPATTAESALAGLVSYLRGSGVQSPVLELAVRWLAANLPEPVAPALVHGDVRTGNLMVEESGLSAVLDWELAHAGQPAEDLGWFCVRAWRFGADDKPAGGFTGRAELLRAYVAAGGRPISPADLRFWETYGTLKWAVTCLTQFDIHRRGDVRSVELAAIGRRLIEAEYDLLLLLEGL
ncbi:phosphotransferase family protein [Nocardia sp. NPDC050712]|uniref:phosphotransferase family protein n=1 Tax=Nocardia sp. NPDC050712 TaxID=3155518 RepID=UPI0033C21973